MIVLTDELIDFADVVRLLIGERPERFSYERAIQLFQFQVWILFPDKKFVEMAGLTAAAKILEFIEEDIFTGVTDARNRKAKPWEPSLVNLNDRPPQTLDKICALRDNAAYRAVHDTFIAALGGLPALLYALPPKELDAAVGKRIEKCSVVTDLVDYQFRYMQNDGSDPKASNVNHAKFFVWWPTRKTVGRKGVKLPDKSVSPKTMNTWWKKLEKTAVFLFLNDHCGFSQIPDAVDENSFVDNLLAAANDIDEVRRFFGAYAFVMEAISPQQKPRLAKIIPVPRMPVISNPFTPSELSTIRAYDDNYLEMGSYLSDEDA